MIITIRGIEIKLLAERAAFLPAQRMLVLADMHLGKLAHFRKNGVFAPLPTQNDDLLLMDQLISEYEPKKVVFLGDLFHSEFNSEFHDFAAALCLYEHVEFILTKGNHDIIPEKFLEDCCISVVSELVLEGGVCLCHQLPKNITSDKYYIIGHIHPGISLRGGGRQRFRLPCFHQQENVLVLPAFGKHTGLFMSKISSEHQVYAVMGDEVVGV